MMIDNGGLTVLIYIAEIIMHGEDQKLYRLWLKFS